MCPLYDEPTTALLGGLEAEVTLLVSLWCLSPVPRGTNVEPTSSGLKLGGTQNVLTPRPGKAISGLSACCQ